MGLNIRISLRDLKRGEIIIMGRAFPGGIFTI